MFNFRLSVYLIKNKNKDTKLYATLDKVWEIPSIKQWLKFHMFNILVEHFNAQYNLLFRYLNYISYFAYLSYKTSFENIM